MVLIDMKMPECCANCPINFWRNCGLLGKIKGCIENPSEKLPNCPLKSVEGIFKTKYKTNYLCK